MNQSPFAAALSRRRAKAPPVTADGPLDGPPPPSIDELPPHSLEAERAVLGGILQAPVRLNDVLEVLGQDGSGLYDLRHRAILMSMVEISERGVVELIALHERLRSNGKLEAVGGLQYVAQLEDACPSAGLLDHYLEIVSEKARIRSMMAALASGLASLKGGVVDPSGAVEEVRRSVMEAGQSSRTANMAYFGDPIVMGRVIDRIEQAASGSVGFLTGIQSIDRKTKGFRPGQLVVIAGRPGAGKSDMMMNWALHGACSTPPVKSGYFSMEMPHEELLERGIANQSLVELYEMQDREGPRVTDAMCSLRQNLNITVCDSSGLTLLEIHNRARRMKMERGISVLFIDYLQLVTARKRGETRENEVSTVARGLKHMALDLGIVVVVGSALSRGVDRDERPPRQSDLRESGEIEQSADTILALYRSTKGEADQHEEKLSGSCKVGVLCLKNRGGGLNGHLINMMFCMKHHRFEEMSRVET